jgi:hypothetical protein
MQTNITTSVSLPTEVGRIWRQQRREIMRFAARYLRLRMRGDLRRAVARRYNRVVGEYEIVTTRFSAAEYDSLHYVASSLRVSVSSLIYGLIKLWHKPARRAIRRFFATNYDCSLIKWDAEAGFLEESICFWRIDPENPRDVPTFSQAP